jgi:hypothetical protein
MKKYRNLAKWTLRIRPQTEYQFENPGEFILIPNVGKPHLHWYSNKGNLSATYTLNDVMLISTPVRVLNNSDEFVLVDVIEI